MAIEIRELKIKGFIDNNRSLNNSNSISEEQLNKLKGKILKECKAEIKKALDRQKRR